MSTSFPYLTLSRCIGADYGRVLGITEKLDAGIRPTYIRDPMASNVYFVWCEEQKRRAAVSE